MKLLGTYKKSYTINPKFYDKFGNEREPDDLTESDVASTEGWV